MHPWLLDGDSFHKDADRKLVPTLKPSDIVVVDNLASHKNKAVRMAIRKSGRTPKTSAHQGREAVSDTAAEPLDTYTPAECANYFKA